MNTQEKKSIALAWGFKKAFDQLKSRDARYEQRRLLTKYFFSCIGKKDSCARNILSCACSRIKYHSDKQNNKQKYENNEIYTDQNR